MGKNRRIISSLTLLILVGTSACDGGDASHLPLSGKEGGGHKTPLLAIQAYLTAVSSSDLEGVSVLYPTEEILRRSFESGEEGEQSSVDLLVQANRQYIQVAQEFARRVSDARIRFEQVKIVHEKKKEECREGDIHDGLMLLRNVTWLKVRVEYQMLFPDGPKQSEDDDVKLWSFQGRWYMRKTLRPTLKLHLK